MIKLHSDTFESALIPLCYEGVQTEQSLATFIDPSCTFREVPKHPTSQAGIDAELLIIDFSDGSYAVLVPTDRLIGIGLWREI